MTKKERLLAYYIDHQQDASLSTMRLEGDCDTQLKECAVSEDTAVIYPLRPYRIEHPHCAIYKKPIEIGQGSAERTTLYTPDGRLHCDYLLESGCKGQVVKPYIKQAKQIGTLLFYLKDIKVYWDQGLYDLALSKVGEQGLLEINLSKSPIQYLLQYMEEDLLMDLYSKQDKLFVRCLKEVGRILRDEIACLAKSGVSQDIHLAYIDDGIHMDIDQALYTDYYINYYRKVLKAVPHMALTLSASVSEELPGAMVGPYHVDYPASEDARMQPTA